jgi:hypothetical protein
MDLHKRIEAFTKLGEFLSQFESRGINERQDLPWNETFIDPFRIQVKRAFESNGWFTQDNVHFAFRSWSKILNEKSLSNWTSSYNLDNKVPKTIGVIMAGNIPLVGFHDFLSVLISGHRILVKQSSSDAFFLPLISKFLEVVEPGFKNYISFTEEKMENFDAVIATGSNNTARHFAYYFGKYPNIIRNSRNSAAILTGNESPEQLEALGEDIFRYFGLGCRSVSKLYVPKGYDFDPFFGAIFAYKDMIQYKKYENNYDYNKAVYLMSRFKLLENGFVMLKEDQSFASPIASIFYEYYDDLDELQEKLQAEEQSIQCIVSDRLAKGHVQFGQTQKPELWDYADVVETLKFLSELDN